MKIGIALGSGAARGWSHFGVLRALADRGIEPDVVAGTSVGALVGAAYASGQLEKLEDWVRKIDRAAVLRLIDADFGTGMIRGEKVMRAIGEQIEDRAIESLPRRFVAVATDLRNGREVWLDSGPMLAAARASCGLPGIFSAVPHNDTWLLDGGLVNPVPVSACIAHGADIVIAVNLNRGLVARRASAITRSAAAEDAGSRERVLRNLGTLFDAWFNGDEPTRPSPQFTDVLYASINIMQDRITRSRLAGEPPYVDICPRAGDVAFWEFHRSGELIAAGEAAVAAASDRLNELQELLASAD